MTQPLLLSSRSDLHASAVFWGLRQLGHDPIWSPSLEALKVDCGLSRGQRPLEGTVSSVWLRRARASAAWAGAQRELLTAGAEGALFWMNSAPEAVRAESKLAQLAAARACALSIPDTLVSNDPKRIREFCGTQASVIYKTFRQHWWTGDGRPRGNYVRVVDDEMLSTDAVLALCPAIFQRRIPKAFDLRVTVVGERMFAVAIDPGAQVDAVDWRENSQSAGFRPYDLPSAYAARLRRLMQQLGLVFGCIDLVADHDGNLHFLEVNQAGQFLFVERALPEIPILAAVCASLSAASPRYSLETAARLISYARYCDSDWCRSWSRTRVPRDRLAGPSQHRGGATKGAGR